MNPHPHLFKSRHAAARSTRLKKAREDRREVVSANDPRLIRLAEIKRVIPQLTREARDITRTLKRCRFLPATCKHCHATWEPSLTPRLRCPKCNRADWLAIPRSYRELANFPPALDVTDKSPEPIEVRSFIDDRAREVGLVPPPRIGDIDYEPPPGMKVEVEETLVLVPDLPEPQRIDYPLSAPPPVRPKLPGRSQADIDADWKLQVEADRQRTGYAAPPLLEDPLEAPSETDATADYYEARRIAEERGLA